MNSYDRIYEMLIKEDDEEEPRVSRRARLRNREAGSMLTRKNQRRLNRVKAGLRKFIGDEGT